MSQPDWDPDRIDPAVDDVNSDDESQVMNRDVSSIASSGSIDVVYKKMLSVHTAIAMLCVTGMLLIAINVDVLSAAACDAGLDDTRKTTDHAVDAVSEAAKNSLDRVSAELMLYTVAGITEIVSGHIGTGDAIIHRMFMFSAIEHANRPKNDTAWLDMLSRFIWYEVAASSLTSSATAVGVTSGDWGIVMYPSDRGHGDPHFQSTLPLECMRMQPQGSFTGTVHPFSGLQINSTAYPLEPEEQKLEKVPGISEAREGLIKMSELKFSNVQPVGNFIGYTLVANLPDASGSSAATEVSLFMSLQHIQAFLANLHQSSSTVNAQSVTRIFTVIASSWLMHRAKELGKPWEGYDQRGLLTGVSHGNATGEKMALDPLRGVMRVTYAALPDVNATDPIIQGVARTIAGNYSGINHAPRQVKVVVNGVKEAHLVAVDRFQRVDMGLDWWVVITIDVASLYAGVLEQGMQVQAYIEADKEKVADKIASDRLRVELISAGVGLALVLVSIALSYRIVRPIVLMQQNMALVANMELESVDLVHKSHLYELSRMQRDFRKMVENLTEFRAYVPVSVLQSSGYSGAGGKEVAEPPTGNVAIVFTDIKGSTELWKSSAGDMNAAMEIHNEVMRDACKDFDGYEVKTIGDAFMVSFHCQYMASKFALQVQSKLALRKWPTGLTLPEAGVVVRIGINYGSTIAEENPVTGRVDYRGSTVNLASRVEAKAKGGTICLTSDMYTAIKPDLAALGNPAIHNHGVHDIKGLGNGHQLYLMVPSHLSKRFSDATTDTEVRGGLVQVKSPKRSPATPSKRESMDSGSTTNSKQRSEREKEKEAKKTGLHVLRSNVTVAVCRVRDTKGDQALFDNCNIMVRSALEAAHATDGVIGNVTGRTLTVVWNASKKCTMHSTAALNFVSEMKKLQGIMQVGLATGAMLHGNVGTKTSRFATAFGTPLEAAEAMNCHASMFGVYCLYADCTSDKRLQSDDTVRACLRMVDAWMDDGKRRVIQIYQMHLPSLAQALQGWGGVSINDEDRDMYVDLEHHSRTVQESMEGVEGLEKLRSLMEESNDPILKRSYELMAEDAPSQGYRCVTRFSRYTKLSGRTATPAVTSSPMPRQTLVA